MAFTLPNTIDPNTEIVAAELEGNFQAVKTDLNTNVIRKDGSVAMTGELLLAGPPTVALSAATKAFVEAWMPVSLAYPCFAATAPAGFAFVNGATYARTAAPLLAAAIAPDSGSPYWVDATNFKLPDMRDRVPVGKGTVRTVLDEKIGSKDAVVITHTHAGPVHAHFFSATTNTTGAHSHGQGAVPFVYSGPLGTATTGVGNLNLTSNFNWNGDNGTHNHSVSGFTDNGASGGDTSSAGVSGTNLNYQPSIVCNWVMRLI